jgi:monoamine oxidase
MPVELGGTWVAPQYHRHVDAEMRRYGLRLADHGLAPGRFVWRFDGAITPGFPLAGEQLYELERVLYRIVEASHRIDVEQPRDTQDLSDLDVSVEAFLRAEPISDRTYEFLSAFGSLGSGAASDEWSALTALSLIAAFDHSAYAWFAAVVDKLEGGTQSLVDALAEDADPSLQTSATVTRITQDDGAVTVACADGCTYRAGAAIVAAPVNVWRDIAFDPPLSDAKATLAREGHPNRMGKVWVLADGVPEDAVGFGPGNDLLFLAPQYRVDDGVLMVGFSSPPALLDVTDAAAVGKAVRAYFPDAQITAVDAHDWVADPFSRGGWLTHRPGQASRLMSGVQRPDGRVCFAGADIANGWIGWIDGALESAHRAAEQALKITATPSSS